MKTKHFLFRAILITWLVALTAMQAEPAAVLAKVGDIEIKADEIRETISGLDAAQQEKIAQDPAALGQYVRALLVERLVLKEAIEKKWDQEPAVISTLVRARESALTESFLKSNSIPEQGYPSEEELKSAYETNKEKFVVPRSFQLAQIYIAKDKSKLEATLKQLKAKNADFASIAKSSSEDPASAAQGGMIGWLSEDQIQPEIRAKLPKLTLNTISEPIQLTDGWHILRVLDIREAHTPTLDQIRDNFVTRLRAEHAQTKRQEYLAQLIKDHPIAINEIELARVVATPAGGLKH
ncbi:MAG: peptidyl-prolyl cis-trans isomerase [Luteolibacter sp.]